MARDASRMFLVFTYLRDLSNALVHSDSQGQKNVFLASKPEQKSRRMFFFHHFMIREQESGGFKWRDLRQSAAAFVFVR